MFHYICPICQTQFVAKKRSRKHCSKHCAIENQKRLGWSKEEIDILYKYSGVLSAEKITKKINLLRKRRGKAKLSCITVRCRMNLEGLSAKTILDSFTTNFLSQLLGVSPATVQKWVKKDNLKQRGVGSKKAFYRITKEDFTEWVRQNIRLLEGKNIPLANLEYALDDPLLAKKIYESDNLPHYAKKSVRRLDTMQIYSSLSEAAKKCFVNRSSIRDAIKRGGTCIGTKWEFVDYE